MSRVGKFNGQHLEKRSFIELAEQVSEIFDNSPVRREQIEAVVVGSQNPFAFNNVDNVAAKISGLLGISGAKSVLIDTASSSGASAFENAYLEVASGRYDHVLALGIQKMTDEQWDAVMDVHVKAPFRILRAAAVSPLSGDGKRPKGVNGLTHRGATPWPRVTCTVKASRCAVS